MNLVYFKEKAELENVVAVHVAYNLTYQQERDPESGQYVYKMDPDVESIVCYPGTKPLINLTYGIKQMIAQEVGLEKMRLEGGGAAASSQKSRIVLPTEELGAEVDRTPRGSKKNTIHLQKFTAKPVKFKARAPTDFFMRALKVEFSRHLRLIDAYQKLFKLNVNCRIFSRIFSVQEEQSLVFV